MGAVVGFLGCHPGQPVLTDEGRRHFEHTARQHTTLVRQLFLDHFSADELETMGSFWARLDDLD